MLRSTKPNKCKHCKERMPEDKARHVLHDQCMDPWIEAQKVKAEKKKAKEQRAKIKVEKAKDKAKLREFETIPQLLALAQKAFNLYIRTRDRLAGHPCISSGRPLDWSGNAVDAGHYRSVGAAGHLRFNENNCHAQSKHDNQWKAGNVVDYRINLIKRIGLPAVEALESDNHVRKWTKEELRAIRTHFINRRKALEKERA